MKRALPLLAFLFLFNFFVPQYILAQRDGAREAGESANVIREQVTDRLREVRQTTDTVRDRFETRRMEARRTLEQKREEFSERLHLVRDEKKQESLVRINDNLSKINEKWVAHWNRVLVRLSEILVKIEARADAAGADKTAINSAKTAIGRAQDAVNTQAGKTYVIEIVDEASLGETVSSAIAGLRNDMSVVKAAVMDARDAVANALRVLKGVNNDNE